MKLNKNVIIVGVLALLLVIGVVQAIQLRNIKSNVNEISISSSSSSLIGGISTSSGGISTSTSANTSSSFGSGVPTNIQNLPGMVGGC